MKVIYVPPNYLSGSASEEEKETAEYFKNVLANMHVGEQTGILLPRQYDDNGKPLFEFEVKSVLGQSAHDISGIIKRLRQEIITGVMTPQIIIGQDGSGSFALSESLENITAAVVENRLIEIQEQLNHDLIPQIFQVNGWDTEVLPYFEYEEIRRVNLDDWSKAVQRVGALGLVKLSAETVNEVHAKLGLSPAYDDIDVPLEELRENSTLGADTGVGEGLEPGTTGNGTAKTAARRDNSAANLEN